MLKDPPYRLLGLTFWSCHGLPAVVVGFVTLVLGLGIVESASQYVKPVELTAIWTEPRSVSVGAILAQPLDEGEPEHGAATQLYKSGVWNRLCDVEAKQTFTDEQGNVLVAGSFHHVDTKHARLGSFDRKHRGLVVPKALAALGPGIYRMKLENTGSCWFGERLFGGLLAIRGMSAEATFQIVP